MALKKTNILPGYKPALIYTLVCLGLVVIVPLGALVARGFSSSWAEVWDTISGTRVRAAYVLSFGASFVAAVINLVLGTLVAWVLVRYPFPGRSIIDAMIDLPFALPTAVAGIALTSLYAPSGWLGKPLAELGISVAFTPLGVVVALTFVGFPFVVRTVQPVLEDLEKEVEEAAETLGATRFETFVRVILPAIMPAAITGFTLAFARGLGEYGSVVFISGNLPFKTEIAPLLIMGQLEQFDYDGATAIALVMLTVSFALLIVLARLGAKAHPKGRTAE